MKMCLICGSKLERIIHDSEIRSGASSYTLGFQVLECGSCDHAQLSALPAIDYGNDFYRTAYNNSNEPEEYFKRHDNIQLRLLHTANLNLRGKVIADFGCGAGSLLDFASNLALATIAIEPNLKYHDSLRKRGHKVFADAHDYLNHEKFTPCDLAVSSHVVEHVENPIEYLKAICASMRPGAQLLITTPNRHDVLLDVAPSSFARFFYRTAHISYFSKSSLELALRIAGFGNPSISTRQHFGISNLINWSLNHSPGIMPNPILSHPALNEVWRWTVQEAAMGEELFGVVKK